MTSEVFENREIDFRTLYDDLRNKIDNQLPRFSGERRKLALREIERDIEEANVLILEMETEVKAAPLPYRTSMMTTLRRCRADVEGLNRTLGRARTGAADRAELFSYPLENENEMESLVSAQRSRLMEGTESLNRASESIARSHMLASETDVVATDIIDELGTQREALIRTSDRLEETETNLSRSRKILKTMGRRVVTNKLILAVIIFVELGILGGVLYYRFFLKKKHK